MKLDEVLEQITPLPWRFVEADNDKIIPTVRMFGRRKSDPLKEVCFGRIDAARDARYACHAANVLPDVVNALRVLLKAQRRANPGISRSQSEFCEAILAKAEAITEKSFEDHRL